MAAAIMSTCTTTTTTTTVVTWIWIASWFVSCVVFNYSCKRLSSSAVHLHSHHFSSFTPWDAVTVQLMASVALGGGVLLACSSPLFHRSIALSRVKKPKKRSAGLPLNVFGNDAAAVDLLPRRRHAIVAAMLLGANGSMMAALQFSSVALFQTVKASSPIFTVAACATILKQRFSTKTYASLVPIVLGFAIAFSGDLSASNNKAGLAYCALSCGLQVAINMYIKSAYDDPKGTETPLEMQLRVNIVATIAALAIKALFHSPLQAASLPLLLITDRRVALNGVLYFCENVCAYSVNARLAQLPYAVTDTLRRLFITMAALFVYPVFALDENAFASTTAAASLLRVTGVLLTIGGSLWYRVEAAQDGKMSKTQRHPPAAARATTKV